MNYGKAEADLERQMARQKYNPVGHATWAGRMYGKGALQTLFGTRRRIYHGVWANVRQVPRAPGALASLPTMPEWYAPSPFSPPALAWTWPPLLAGPVLLSALLSWVQAADHAHHAVLFSHRRNKSQRIRMRARAFLYRMQPLARFISRDRQAHPVFFFFFLLLSCFVRHIVGP